MDLLIPRPPVFLPAPQEIAGLGLWLRADASVYSDTGTILAINGQTVQQWNDQSGNGKHATESTAGLRPTYIANVRGMPALQFSYASGTQMQAGGNSDFADQQFTVFVAYEEPTAPSAAPSVICKGDSTPSWELATDANLSSLTTFVTITVDNNAHFTDCVMGTGLTTQVVCMQRVSNSQKKFYRYGNLINTTSDDGGLALHAGTAPLFIGNHPVVAPARNFNGYIREILYWPRSLSALEIAQVFQYLNRWPRTGRKDLLTVPGRFPQKTDPGTPPGGLELHYRQSDSDGSDWFVPAGVTDPVYVFPAPGGGPPTSASNTQNCGLVFYNNKYWIVHEYQDNSPTQSGTIGLASAPALSGPWSYVMDITVFSTPLANCCVWDPQFFVDDDGSVHVVVIGQNRSDGGFQNALSTQPYLLTPLNSDFTSWSSATLMTGPTLPSCCFDFNMIPPRNSPNGKYNMFFVDVTNSNAISRMSSSSLLTGWTVDQAITSLGSGYEIPVLCKMPNGNWRLFLSPVATAHARFVESTDNWATWNIFFPGPITAPTFMPEDGLDDRQITAVGGAVTGGMLQRSSTTPF